MPVKPLRNARSACDPALLKICVHSSYNLFITKNFRLSKTFVNSSGNGIKA